jgi:hypothetical protein
MRSSAGLCRIRAEDDDANRGGAGQGMFAGGLTKK